MIPDMIIIKKFIPPRFANKIVIQGLSFLKVIYEVGAFLYKYICEMHFLLLRNIATVFFLLNFFVCACIFVGNNIDRIDYPRDC